MTTDELAELAAIYTRWLNNEIATNSHEMRQVISAVPRMSRAIREGNIDRARLADELKEARAAIAARDAFLRRVLAILHGDTNDERSPALAAEIAAVLNE